MAGTKSGGAKFKARMIEKYGSEEAWLEYMRHIAQKGGSRPTTGGFAGNRELARRAGRLGGLKSRRSQ